MSTEELFAATLEGERDDDEPWEAVHALRLRGTPEVFEAAKRYCRSGDSKARARGLEVLAQLGEGKPDSERPFLADSVAVGIEHLTDRDPQVLSSAAWALSHLGTPAGVAVLIGLRNHPDAEVRHAIACCGDLKDHPDAESILISLMEDGNEVVRDWATFAIGTWALVKAGTWRWPDSPQIREALKRRLDDPYEEARREAIWGLARRKDPLGLRLLLECLESKDCRTGDVDAAAETLELDYDAPLAVLREGLSRLFRD
jgi:HEAT repeat protein